MDKLRSPGGCLWDQEQTHETLLKYLIEESYEFIESVESGNREDIKEELGDVLLQVFFHSRIAEEDTQKPFNIDDVAQAVAEKLISRHPHIFSQSNETSSKDLRENWETIKSLEKNRSSFDQGVPTGQPALALARALVYRAKRNSLPTPLFSKEISPADDLGLGSELLALVAWAVENDIDPEMALRKAALDYRNQLLSNQKG
jgi:XTP/dITP diphosphohydrolase